jgi:negative regulator of sigma E activity
MEDQTNENIEELFGKFLSDQDARRAAEDIQKAGEILREHPAPEPAGELLADINSKIAEALSAEKAKTRKLTAYRVAAVAAAIIILVAIGVRFFEKGPAETQSPVTITLIQQAIWESEDISADQAELALLTDELEQIEGEILALRLGEDGGESSREFIELEMELTDIGGDFWKG